jgi:hypothetical protein
LKALQSFLKKYNFENKHGFDWSLQFLMALEVTTLPSPSHSYTTFWDFFVHVIILYRTI